MKRFTVFFRQTFFSALLVLVFISNASCQPPHRHIFSSSTSLFVSWGHSWLDVSGAKEFVSKFSLQYVLNGTDTSAVFFTSVDTVKFRPPLNYTFTNLPPGELEILVYAIDRCGNISTSCSSMDAYLGAAGWVYAIDVSIPSPPYELKYKKGDIN